MSTLEFASHAPGAPQALAHYGVIELPNGLVLLPGQGCRDAVSNLCAGISRKPDGSIERYDIRAQAEGVFRNVEALLGAAGLTRHSIVDVTVFMKNKADFPAMNEVWNAFFKESKSPPARTTVFVLDLPGENFIEMKVLAFRSVANAP
jgi:2-aminomuconate deaminase